MKALRLILVLLIGVILIYLTYKTKYQTFIFDTIIGGLLLIGGLLIFSWTIIKDIQLFKAQRRIKNFTLTFLVIFFVAVIFIVELEINHGFNKPTLLKVFYNGDYNGTGIDFKTDGTYILDNSAIGMSDYFYGTYQINGSKIIMDKDTIDNLCDLKYLKLVNKQIVDGETELYLFQGDSLGNIIARSDEYKVTIDNRKL